MSFLGDFFSGQNSLGGDASKPYQDAMKQYQHYGQLATDQQQPYYQAGQQGLGNYQGWLNNMKDPNEFINHIMSGYQQSPYAKNLQQQSLGAAQNAASASGLLGSSPFMGAVQDNAGNIANQDMHQYLSDILGINTEYGAGEQRLAGMGQHSADILSQLYQGQGEQMGSAAYGARAGQEQNRANNFGFLGSLGGILGRSNFFQGGKGANNGSPFNYLSHYHF